MNPLDHRQNKIVEEFSKFQKWEDKYRHIIELGKKLDALPDSAKTEDLKVKGCQSQVWLKADVDRATKKINFKADSDAVIVRGLIALLIEVYSDASPQEILGSPPHFITKVDLGTHLSPSRANGLNAMVKQIMHYAVAYDHLLK